MRFTLIILSLVLSCGLLQAQTPVKMKKEGGIYMIPCKVNGLKLKFVFDTGASDVSISSTEALFMLKNDYLSADDFTGTQQYRVANGDLQEGYTFTIKELEIGGVTIRDVKANVVKNLDAPLLLGQSALSKFGRITFDYDTETLYLGSGSNNTPTNTKPTTSNDGSYTEYGISPSFKMIAIPAGTFIMGCTSEQSDCESNEKPTHSVTLSGFYMSETEVTQAQWYAIMGTKPSHFKDCDNCPVEEVSWDYIQTFLSKLNTQCGKRYRLPTEAEWEYAARGGQNYKYAGSNNIDDVAWHSSNSGSKTHAVKGKIANGYGLYDMTGNVGEWCSDWIGDYSNRASNNPQGVSSGYGHIIRGCGWLDYPENYHLAARSGNWPNYGNDAVGFRLVISK